MTTRLIADSEHMDHVTILLARVCAARLDATITAEDFVRMIARLVDVAVAEAIADHASNRPTLPAPKELRCMYCMQTVEGPHDCKRMRELGFGTDKLLDKLGVIDENRSTGAAAIAQRAEQPSANATATEPPAAPSTVAAPAPSTKPAKPLSDPAGDDAGTSPAGVSAGAGKSHGTGHRMTRQQVAALRSAYDAALAAHGGALPHGWQKEQARVFGFTPQAVADRARAWTREAAAQRAHDYAAGELPHTETPGCWCRKQPASRDNVWCKLRRAEKPATNHAALREPERRVRHVVGTRY